MTKKMDWKEEPKEDEEIEWELEKDWMMEDDDEDWEWEEDEEDEDWEWEDD